MVILIVTRDKITQHEFKAKIAGIENYAVVGTNANQDQAALDERIAYVEANKAQKSVAIFHALKGTLFKVPPEWNPEVGADYPGDLHDLADFVIYTPGLLHTTHGRTPTVLKGDLELLKGLLIPGTVIQEKEKPKELSSNTG